MTFAVVPESGYVQLFGRRQDATPTRPRNALMRIGITCNHKRGATLTLAQSPRATD
jgi:hypothetical protein